MRSVISKILTVAVVACVAAALVLAFRRAAVRRQADYDVPSRRRVIPVTTRPAAPRTFRKAVRVAGNVQAKNHAAVSARIAGTLDAVYVDEGDVVEAGRTPLFQIDAVKLTRRVEVAERELDVAEFQVAERRANSDRAWADLAKARVDYDRYKRLYEDHRAVTADAFESKQLQYRQTDAAAAHAEAALQLSRRKLRQAQSRLAIARKELSDSLVFAPLSGSVAERRLEPGETAKVGDAVVRIEDPSLLEVSCFVPAEYYPQVRVDETVMRCWISGIEITRKVSYVSPTVDPALRAFEVRCLISDPPAGVAPGLMARVEMVLQTRRGVGVPSEAVLQRRDGRVVFVVDGSRAREAAVKIGWTTGGHSEIVEGLEPGAAVVTMGQFLLRDGADVKIVEEE